MREQSLYASLGSWVVSKAYSYRIGWVLVLGPITTDDHDRCAKWCDQVGKEIELLTGHHLTRGSWSGMSIGHVIAILHNI